MLLDKTLLLKIIEITITGFSKITWIFRIFISFKYYNDNIFNWFNNNIKQFNKIYKNYLIFYTINLYYLFNKTKLNLN